MRFVLPAALCAALACAAAQAETTTYKYDSLGRLQQSCQQEGPLAGRRGDYSYDAAGNRANLDEYIRSFRLNGGEGHYSADGRFYFVMQGDGNLVLYSPFGVLWASSTFGSGFFTQFQNDGNLVIYNAASAPVWASGTGGQYCARFDIQNDGNVVITNADGAPVWATNSGGH